MVSIFEIRGDEFIVTEHALCIPEMKLLWDRDRLVGKPNAFKDFKYIEMMLTPKKSSPVFGLTGDAKEDKIKSSILKDMDYRPDQYVKDAMEAWESFLESCSINYTTIKAARAGVFNLQEYLTDKEIYRERNKSGALVFKPSEIIKIVQDLKETISEMDLIERAVLEDMLKFTVIRGKNAEIGYFER